MAIALKGSSVPAAAVEDRVLDSFERSAIGVRQAHPDGVRPATCNQRVVRGQAIEDGRCILRNFSRRKAEPAGNDGVNLEVRGGPADGIVDAILGIHHSGNFGDGLLNARTKVSRRFWSLENNLIWMGSGELERSPIISCRICVNSISSDGSAAWICWRRRQSLHRCERERSVFRRTVKSPELASVTAARPICRPVRREVIDTSGVRCRI